MQSLPRLSRDTTCLRAFNSAAKFCPDKAGLWVRIRHVLEGRSRMSGQLPERPAAAAGC
jgi:hypothetical protein